MQGGEGDGAQAFRLHQSRCQESQLGKLSFVLRANETAIRDGVYTKQKVLFSRAAVLQLCFVDFGEDGKPALCFASVEGHDRESPNVLGDQFDNAVVRNVLVHKPDSCMRDFRTLEKQFPFNHTTLSSTKGQEQSLCDFTGTIFSSVCEPLTSSMYPMFHSRKDVY